MRGINEESSNFRHIDLNRILTREPWISRRARYPETTEADFAYVTYTRFIKCFSLLIL